MMRKRDEEIMRKGEGEVGGLPACRRDRGDSGFRV
jgi:hypothetical protein